MASGRRSAGARIDFGQFHRKHRYCCLPPPHALSLATLLVEHTPDALVLLGPEGEVQAWNPAAEAIFGHRAEEATGRHLPTLIGAQAQPLLSEPCDRSQHELVAARADGERIDVTCRQQRLPDGRRLCLFSDVTLQRAQQGRDFLHARFGDLFDSLPDAIVAVNGIGRIVLANRQAGSLFGHVPEALIGEPVERLLPPRLRAQHVPQRRAYLDAPGLRPMGRGLELYGLHAAGHEFPVAVSLSPVQVDGRGLVIAAIRDITDRKAIEQALQQKNVELERANRAKDHFLATMSHELRTPLNAILGFTGLMLMKLPGPLTEAQERQLGHVQSSGRHLLSLINDLLDLARIESGHVELACEPVEARAVVEEVLAVLRPAAQAKGLALEALLPEGPLPLHADRRALHQVVLNLTGNAVKFTAQGGITIRLRTDPLDGARARLDVADTGVGIRDEDQARLFGAFVQVGAPRPGEGTGLGLHLSRKLAELMGGTLTVVSAPGQGSVFTLCLAKGGAWP